MGHFPSQAHRAVRQGAADVDDLAVFVLRGQVGAIGHRALLVFEANLFTPPLGAPAVVVVAVGAHLVAMDAEGMALVVVPPAELHLRLVIPYGGMDIYQA